MFASPFVESPYYETHFIPLGLRTLSDRGAHNAHKEGLIRRQVCFALIDGMLIAQPGRPSKVDGVNVPVGAHSVFYYPAEAFNDFTLRLQFRLSGPIGNTGRPIDNSGIFLRFHAPHSKGPDLPTNADPALQQNVADDAAWVAAYTGFEIQIDENAAPDGADKHRTGAIYNVPMDPGGLQNFTAAAPLSVGVRIPTKSPGHSEMMSPGVPT